VFYWLSQFQTEEKLGRVSLSYAGMKPTPADFVSNQEAISLG
jgi:hypothetical protein